MVFYALSISWCGTLEANSSAPTEQNTILTQIQALRVRGELEAAKKLALDYLAKTPEDGDVLLLLGLIYKAQKNYPQAEICLTKVLDRTPLYLDARIGLIHLKREGSQFYDAQTLINTGLILHPGNEQLLALKESINQNLMQEAKNSYTSTAPPPKVKDTVNEIQRLRKLGKNNEARYLALNHLKNYPEDVDVMLLLGLLYRQQQRYDQASYYLTTVLQKKETYLDARVGLIRVKKDQKQFKDALTLVTNGLKLHPHNQSLIKLRKDILSEQSLVKRKTWRRSQISIRTSKDVPPQNSVDLIHQLNNNPEDADTRIKLANLYLAEFRDMRALRTINQGLKQDPNNSKLLIKKGQIQQLMFRYALAADAYKKALYHDPNNKEARSLLNEINSISPYFTYGPNEIGIRTENKDVSDPYQHSIWNYSNLYYSLDTDYGALRTQLNYASRQNKHAPQLEVAFSPRLNRRVYFDLMGAYANEPVLFPKVTLGIEGHFDNPKLLNLSLGGKYANIGPTYFTTYTGALDHYFGNYWVSFRPYYFVPKDNNTSILYTGIIRRYFTTVDHFLSLHLGSGKSPDLADLITVNFLVIKNDFINLDYQFPLFHHQLLLNLGVGYQRWQYPSRLLRNLYNGSIGLKYRF